MKTLHRSIEVIEEVNQQGFESMRKTLSIGNWTIFNGEDEHPVKLPAFLSYTIARHLGDAMEPLGL
jgi:hypothetical protein